MGKKLPTDAEVIDLLKANVLVSSAVTSAPEDYVTEACSEYLTAYYLTTRKAVTVNEDPEQLQSAMIFASLSPTDFKLLLNSCVPQASGLKISAGNNKKDGEDVEKDNIQKVAESLAEMSLESIIEFTKEAKGQPRVRRTKVSSTEERRNAVIEDNISGFSFGAIFEQFGDDKLYIQRPAEIDYSKLNWKALEQANTDTWELLDKITQYEAGKSDILAIPIIALPADVKSILNHTERWSKLGYNEAQQASYSSIKFNVVKDPWAAFGQMALGNSQGQQSDPGLQF